MKVTIKYKLSIFCLSLLVITTNVQAAIDNNQPDADFLEFLAEVDEATGDGFETWLETDAAADSATEENE